jgi:hypothetical protein
MPGSTAVKIERIKVPTVGKHVLDGMKEMEKKGRITVKAIKEYLIGVETSFAKLSKELEKIDKVNQTNFSSALSLLPPIDKNILKKGVAVKIDKFDIYKRKEEIKESLESPKIQGGALRMLKVLVSRYPVKLTKSQLGTFAKMKPTSGTFGTYLSILRGVNFIELTDGLLSATESGIDYLGESPNPPQTSEEIIEMWKNNLTGGSRRMFDQIVGIYPDSISKEQLGIEVDMVHTSGSFGTYISILKSNGLIEVKGGEIKASDNLFDI